MRPQHNRMPPSAAKGFGGNAIDRSRPLTFRLDGRMVSGFAGDTVLSAAIASGIDTLGTFQDSVIALTSSAAPVIVESRHADRLDQALPMARTPAINGADFVTLGGRRSNMFARLFMPGRTLGLGLDAPHALDRPWRALGGTLDQPSDFLVIGAGVAGMSAALGAARRGNSVTLIEASPQLGGHSGLFGTQDGEDAPEASMSRLRDAVRSTPAIRVLIFAHAYALRAGLARIHHVDISDGTARARVLDLPARFIVIATGARERLPIFGGNRLPGVSSTLEAYDLVSRYGVWPGQSAIFATNSNFAYRLATLASDNAIAIPRILDARTGPSSRFIEFSRAYGIVQAPGTGISGVQQVRNGAALAITMAGNDTPLEAERLIVCGGWQPDLTLWHVAGGSSRWSEIRHRLEPEGQVEGIALAGSVAGYLTRRGCIQSGADAVDLLLGRTRKPVDDPTIDPLYETPDAPTAIAPDGNLGAPAFLDSGPEFLQRPQAAQRSLFSVFRPRSKGGLTALSEAPQPLTVNDVAAGVDLGLIPTAAAGIVAQERVALVALGVAEAASANPDRTAPPPTEVPPYLMGRFGAGAHVVRIIPGEQRHFEPGAMIFANADDTRPSDAIGVILRPHESAATALVAATAAHAGFKVSVRDRGRSIAAAVELGGLAEPAA